MQICFRKCVVKKMSTLYHILYIEFGLGHASLFSDTGFITSQCALWRIYTTSSHIICT